MNEFLKGFATVAILVVSFPVVMLAFTAGVVVACVLEAYWSGRRRGG